MCFLLFLAVVEIRIVATLATPRGQSTAPIRSCQAKNCPGKPQTSPGQPCPRRSSCEARSDSSSGGAAETLSRDAAGWAGLGIWRLGGASACRGKRKHLKKRCSRHPSYVGGPRPIRGRVRGQLSGERPGAPWDSFVGVAVARQAGLCPGNGLLHALSGGCPSLARGAVRHRSRPPCRRCGRYADDTNPRYRPQGETALATPPGPFSGWFCGGADDADDTSLSAVVKEPGCAYPCS